MASIQISAVRSVLSPSGNIMNSRVKQKFLKAWDLGYAPVVKSGFVSVSDCENKAPCRLYYYDPHQQTNEQSPHLL